MQTKQKPKITSHSSESFTKLDSKPFLSQSQLWLCLFDCWRNGRVFYRDVSDVHVLVGSH